MSRNCLFGAIADDYTGGSDLAGMLSNEGVRTVQLFGIPSEDEIEKIFGEYDAVVVCLKSRSIPAAEAQQQSLAALSVLQRLGARQIQFKYCSTFDSTARGNIGPVTESLLAAIGAPYTIAVPALPVNKRTQYLGYLFVGGELLSESPMRNHPLNPMTDSNLIRHLQAQTALPVTLVDLTTVRRGAEAIRECLSAMARAIALIDAVEDGDIGCIAEAVVDLPFITGGSGLGMALPRVWRDRQLLPATDVLNREPARSGGTLIVSGSCSAATLRQLDELEREGQSAIAVDVRRLAASADSEVERILGDAHAAIGSGGVAVVRSSAAPENRDPALSGDGISSAIERAFGFIAGRMVDDGAVNRIIVAGGETSGAVVNALGIRAVEITGTIDPGVPGLKTLHDPPLWLALKSGNFGAADFFRKTMRYWEPNG